MALPAGQEYDFAAFSPAKKREAEPRTPELKKVAPLKKTREQIREEKRMVAVRCFRAIVAGVVLSTLGFMNIYGYCKCDIAARKYDALTEEYKMVQSDNTRLSMELNSMVSLDQIEKIAVEKLGLVKISSSDIEYVKISKGNKVLVSSGEATE